MSGGGQVACNRRVHAEVRVTDAVTDRDHVEAGFRAEQWSFEELETGRYLLSVPVYCARFAAIDVARAKMFDFSETIAKLEIKYLRSQTERPRYGFLYRSRQARKSASKKQDSGFLTPARRFGPEPMRSARPVWELFSDHALGDHYLDHLEERFTPNYAGGEIELRKVASPPQKVTSDREPQRWHGGITSDSAFIAVIAVEVLLISVAASMSIDTYYRVATGIAGLLVAAIAGWAVAGNVSGRAAKVGSFALPIIMTVFIGGLFWLVGQSSGRSPLSSVVLVAVLAIVARGLLHLLRLRPRVRVLASISVATALAALSFGGARILASSAAEDFGVPFESASVPAWVVPVAGLFMLGYLLIGAVLAGSTVGWFEYIGASTAFRKSPDILTGLLFLLSIMFVLTALIAALAAGEQRYGAWFGEFQQHKTPWATSGFMYRACLAPYVESGDQNSSTSSSSTGQNGAPFSTLASTHHPIVVIEGKNGPEWVWDASAKSSEASNGPDRINADMYQIAKTDDGKGCNGEKLK